MQYREAKEGTGSMESMTDPEAETIHSREEHPKTAGIVILVVERIHQSSVQHGAESVTSAEIKTTL